LKNEENKEYYPEKLGQNVFIAGEVAVSSKQRLLRFLV
jgi:hypothetical protein